MVRILTHHTWRFYPAAMKCKTPVRFLQRKRICVYSMGCTRHSHTFFSTDLTFRPIWRCVCEPWVLSEWCCWSLKSLYLHSLRMQSSNLTSYNKSIFTGRMPHIYLKQWCSDSPVITTHEYLLLFHCLDTASSRMVALQTKKSLRI